MQRVLVVAVGLGTLGAGRLWCQEAAGASLWRVAATTMPVPPALATGAAAAFWNPAQSEDSARTQVAFEIVQTPASIDATGMLGAARWRVESVGEVGVVYGRVWFNDLARTIDSPDVTGGEVPVYSFALGATWSRRMVVAGGHATVGATLAFHETRLDTDRATRWTADVGGAYELGRKLRLAAATHFFSSFRPAEATQDLYAGVEYLVWEGPLWGGRATFRGRYGLAFGRGFAADHHLSVGAEFGGALALEAAVVREGGYRTSNWRPIGGLRLRIGKYRITLARDTGVQDLGAAYRVGVDARFP
ncbi:MAG: hypothetical protein ACREMN_05710 [Gemmatimonadales bacterium]